MVGDTDGECEVGAEQGSYGARDGGIQQDVLDEPVFLSEWVLTVFSDEVECTLVDVVGNDGLEEQEALSTVLQHL